MNLHRAIAEAVTAGLKTGIVPFLADGRCLFLSGEDGPVIATTAVDGEEDAKAAAIRAGESFGLQRSNMAAAPFLGWSGKMMGTKSYPFEVYAVLVKEEDGFDNHGDWLTPAQFATKGRKAQAEIMEKVFGKIEVYLKSK